MSELSELLQAAHRRNPMTLRQREAKADGGIQFGTIGAYLRGRHPSNPEESTLRALSKAFDVPLEQLQRAAGVKVGGHDWAPPPEVSRLTKRQQNALTELIMAMATGGSSDDRRSEAQKSRRLRSVPQPNLEDLAADKAPGPTDRERMETEWGDDPA